MFRNKKSQLLVLSGLILILSLVFIYSLETGNNYIRQSGEIYIIDNVISEVCNLGKMSNGTNIDARYQDVVLEIDEYCDLYGFFCNVSIVKQAGAPTNLSLLNYTHYDYSVSLKTETTLYRGGFNC
ncbi:MAG: hypothetical protein ACOCXG_01805 [Nanoarchaeota archaeon]